MKRITVLFFVFVTCLSSFSQTCQEVFVSEVVFSKDSTQTLIGSTTSWIENYALELYNPTNADIDLLQYSIHLIPQTGNPTIITLTDSIRTEATYVISKLGADFDLTSLSEMVTNDLDYDNFVAIELYKDSILLDRVGQIGLTLPDSIDVVQAIADPASYLNSLNLDLSSLDKLVFRRNPIVGRGNTDFDSTAKEWYVAPNDDYTNVHHHTNICKETDVIVEFAEKVYYAFEGIKVYPTLKVYNYNNATMQGTITVAIQQMPNAPYTLTTNPYYASMNEIGPTTTVLGIPSITADILPIIDNQIEPTEVMMYKLYVVPIIIQGTAYFNAKVNPAKQYTTILIQDAIFSATDEEKKGIAASIFPNPITADTYLKYNLIENTNVEISISNLMGQILKIVSSEKKIAGNHEAKISMEDIASGMYILRIKTDNGIFATKLVKN